MRYALANIVWFLAQPSSIIALMFATGLTCRQWQRLARLGGRLVLAAGLLVVLFGLSPAANVLILPLEQRFTTTDLARIGDIAGIIVLGGGEDGRISAARGQLTLNEAGERISEAAVLARRLPRAQLIFTGGAGAIFGQGQPGGDMVEQFWRGTGIDAARIVIESQSLTTYENAQFTQQLLKPQRNQRWLLVTSAFHMPRSVGLFRKAGFDVVPHPVDFRTKDAGDVWKGFNSIPRGLQRLDEGAREWTSLIAHRLLGRTDALLPAP